MLTSSVPFKMFNFPCGETQIVVSPNQTDPSTWVRFDYENDKEIFQLLILCDTLKRNGYKLDILHMPYVPYSRQDRVNAEGECLSIKTFCDLINSIEFKTVEIIDPHSNVTSALLNNVMVTEQHDVFKEYFKSIKKHYYLVCPDNGAYKKTNKLASLITNCSITYYTKIRSEDGKVICTNMSDRYLSKSDCYIVDDICDGGATFIQIAERLKELDAGKITLMVTHGFFTKGVEVFDGLIDEIYTRKGRLK